MLSVVQIPVGLMQSNCYLIIDRTDNEALIIDPGDDADFIIRKLLDEQVKPTHILATHGHFDHIMAAYELQMAFSLPFYVSKLDGFLIDNMRSNAQHFLKTDPGPPPVITDYLSPASTIALGPHMLTLIDAPGHTPGSLCFYCPDEKWIMVGDVLFQGGAIGRSDFSYSSPLKLSGSVQTILSLPPETVIYPGHGDTTTIASEIQYHS